MEDYVEEFPIINAADLALEPFDEGYPPNPHAAAMTDDLRRWAAEHRLASVLGPGEKGPAAVERFIKVSVGVAALVFPEADKEKLRLAVKQNFLLFPWDGPADGEINYAPEDKKTSPEGIRVIERLSEFYEIFESAENIIENPQDWIASPNPYISTLADFVLQIRQRTNQRQFAWWKETYSWYLRGVELELYFRDFGITPRLDEFLAMREETPAVKVVTSLLEPELGIELTDEEWESEIVQEALRLANRKIGVDNDYLSFRIESAMHRAELNLLTVLMRERGYSLTDANKEALRMSMEAKAAFEDLERRLQASNASPRVLRFVGGLRYWINGYLRSVKELTHYDPDDAAAQ